MTSTHDIGESRAYIIEVGDTAAGIVNRYEGESQYTFISASSAFFGLEGRRFATPRAAEMAARELVNRRGR